MGARFLRQDHLVQRPESPHKGVGPCREHPRLFFDPHKRGIDKAKAICATCPVRRECLEHALKFNERFGVWGGTDEKERKGMRRQREAA